MTKLLWTIGHVESLATLVARVEVLMRIAQRSPFNVLCVTHGGVIELLELLSDGRHAPNAPAARFDARLDCAPCPGELRDSSFGFV